MLPTSADVHWVRGRGRRARGDGRWRDADRHELLGADGRRASWPRRPAPAASTSWTRPSPAGCRGATDGTLTIMAGGRDAAVERVRPLLEAMGSRVLHVGPVGAGHALKALNNLLSATHLLATAEAVAIGRRFGLDPKLMVDVINTSSGRERLDRREIPELHPQRGLQLGLRRWALMVKDVGIAVGLGEELERPRGARRADARALARGRGGAAGGCRPHRDRTLGRRALLTEERRVIQRQRQRDERGDVAVLAQAHHHARSRSG